MKILITGATSAIAQSTARALILEYSTDCQFILVGRNNERLDNIAKDLLVRGAQSVSVICADLVDCDQIDDIVENSWNQLNHIDVAVIAQGTLPEQEKTALHWKEQSACWLVLKFKYAIHNC